MKRDTSAELRTRIGAEIRAARMEAGLTQSEVAAALEMNQGHLSEIERGLINVTLETLCSLADLFDRVVALTLIKKSKVSRVKNDEI